MSSANDQTADLPPVPIPGVTSNKKAQQFRDECLRDATLSLRRVAKALESIGGVVGGAAVMQNTVNPRGVQ